MRGVWYARRNQMYGELAKLTEAGFAEEVAEGPRGRRTYTVTPAGRADTTAAFHRLQELLGSPPALRGRIENSQIGVFLANASLCGWALIDRELLLPKECISDRERCGQVGIPDEVTVATKTVLAQRMSSRAVEAGVPFGWVTEIRPTAWTPHCG